MTNKMGRAVLWSVGLLCVAGFAQASVELAKVNGKSITDSDLVDALAGFNEGQRESILKEYHHRKQILTGLIDQEVLVTEAEKSKLDQEADYKRALNQFKRQFLAARMAQKAIAPKLTQDAAKKYFENNKTRFSTDELQVQHILLADEAKAKEVLKLAQEPGADFMKLAETYSLDPTAKNNRGDVGIVTHDSAFVPEFKHAAFMAKVGEVSQPVRTEYGYHLIKVVNRKVGRILNFDEVEIKVKEELKAGLLRDYLFSLKKGVKISVNDAALKKMSPR